MVTIPIGYLSKNLEILAKNPDFVEKLINPYITPSFNKNLIYTITLYVVCKNKTDNILLPQNLSVHFSKNH